MSILGSEPLPRSKVPNNVEDFSEEFFRWMETYHPLRTMWEKQNANSDGESYPYSAFRDIAKRRLVVMLKEFINSKNS